MKKNWLRIAFIVILLSTTILACQAGSAFPSLFATETPTVTMTPSVTPSPTATSTPIPSLTPTPLPTGVDKQELSTGDILFTDYDAGYTFQLSKDWLVIPATMEDLQDMSKTLEESNPDLAKAMRGLQSIDSDALRLMAFNQNRDLNQGTMITNVNAIIQQEDILMALPMDFFIDANVEQIKSALPGSKVLSSKIFENANGVEVGVIELELKANTTSGQSVTAYEKMVAIKTDTAFNLITFAWPNSRKDVLLPLFDEIINTIKLLNP